MPGDVPVATVGVGSGGARNAGLLAVQILAIYDADLQGLFVDFRRKLADKVNAKNVALQTALRKEGRPYLASQ
jgi:phosphoribosylcarboxyaminoimidazole (NCAIR) mutase